MLSGHTLQDYHLSLVKKEEQEMLETQSIPLRNYLMQHVMPTLTEGLIEVSKVKPEDAIDYLVSPLVYPTPAPIHYHP